MRKLIIIFSSIILIFVLNFSTSYSQGTNIRYPNQRIKDSTVKALADSIRAALLGHKQIKKIKLDSISAKDSIKSTLKDSLQKLNKDSLNRTTDSLTKITSDSLHVADSLYKLRVKDSLNILLSKTDSIKHIQDSIKKANPDTILPPKYLLVDTTLAKRLIFNILQNNADTCASNVILHQSRELRAAMFGYFDENKTRNIDGFRIRIFFDNKQNARERSGKIIIDFHNLYPELSAYRSYQDPYFKVSIGDFRSKSQALEVLQEIKKEFPSAFIIRDIINYPAVNAKDYPQAESVADTVRADSLNVIKTKLDSISNRRVSIDSVKSR